VRGVAAAGAAQGAIWGGSSPKLEVEPPPPVMPIWLFEDATGAHKPISAIALAQTGETPYVATASAPAAAAETQVMPAQAVMPCAPSPALASPQERYLGAGGAVEQTVADRIDQDSRKMGLVAQHLVEIQESFRGAEQEAMSKSLNLESMKAFFERHKAEVEEQKVLQRQSAELLGKVSALSQQLNKAREQTRLQEVAYKKQEKRLTGDIAEEKAKLPNLLDTLDHRKMVAQANTEMTKANDVLVAQNMKALAAVQTVRRALELARHELERRRNLTAHFEASKKAQEEYAKQCQNDEAIVKEREEMVEAARKEPWEKAKMEEKLSAQAYAKQLMINNMLRARLAKAKANKGTIQSQVVLTQQHLFELRKAGEGELGRMRGELSTMREEVGNLENELTRRVQERQALEKDISTLEAQIKILEEKLLSGELAALKANNTRLKTELHRAQDALEKSQARLSAAQARTVRANLTVGALAQTAAENTQKAQQVAREALAQVVAAKRESEAEQERADDETMKAQSAQLADCDALWDEKNPQILGFLEQCKTVEADLESATAQVASLTSLTASASEAEAATTPALGG